MKRIQLQPAYVLHRRAYRETSFLVDLFTRDHGRLTVVARGVRKAVSSAQGLLQPFTPICVTCSGNGEMMTLGQVEAGGDIKHLYGDCLFAGFYLHELIITLLQKWDPHPVLFAAYERTITALQTKSLEEKTLRSFEKILLEELGYGVLPRSEAALNNMFSADQYYRFIPEHGFVQSERGDEARATANIFIGKSLIAMAREDWCDPECLAAAKRLTRLALTPLLGARQLNSRKLFMQVEEKSQHEE